MFKKPEFLVLGISFLITSLISSLVGLGGFLVVGKFWAFFLLAFGIQIIIFAVINTILMRKDALEATRLITEQLEATSKHVIKISCAYCQVPNTIPLVLNQENRFKCESCNQINGVKMQFFATQITTPLEKITMPALEDLDVS